MAKGRGRKGAAVTRGIRKRKTVILGAEAIGRLGLAAAVPLRV